MSVSVHDRSDLSAALPASLARHSEAAALLGRCFADPDSAAHAYLFHGQPGSGIADVARDFAAALLVGSGGDADHLGMVMRGTHPDLVWVSPSGAHELLSSDIDRSVVAAVSTTPFMAKRRVFVIDGVDRMNQDAANRLLKTLEEPPSYVHIVLLAASFQRVIGTVQSRCQSVRFSPLSHAVLVEDLVAAGVADRAAASAAAYLSGGSLLEANHLLAGEGVAERTAAELFIRAAVAGRAGMQQWQGILDLAKRAGELASDAVSEEFSQLRSQLPVGQRRKFDSELSERAHRAARRASTDSIDRSLRLVLFWLRDLLALHVGGSAVFNADRSEQLAEDLAGISLIGLYDAIEDIERLRAALVLNVGLELAFDALAVRLNGYF